VNARDVADEVLKSSPPSSFSSSIGPDRGGVVTQRAATGTGRQPDASRLRDGARPADAYGEHSPKRIVDEILSGRGRIEVGP